MSTKTPSKLVGTIVPDYAPKVNSSIKAVKQKNELPMCQKVGLQLKKIREEKGSQPLILKELERATGVSYQQRTWQRWEKSLSSIDTIWEIATALEIDPIEFLRDAAAHLPPT